eukprot:2614568-Amphidinium_carterae.1
MTIERRGEKIGSGSYGSVYKALCKDSGLIFAVASALSTHYYYSFPFKSLQMCVCSISWNGQYEKA